MNVLGGWIAATLRRWIRLARVLAWFRGYSAGRSKKDGTSRDCHHGSVRAECSVRRSASVSPCRGVRGPHRTQSSCGRYTRPDDQNGTLLIRRVDAGNAIAAGRHRPREPSKPIRR